MKQEELQAEAAKLAAYIQSLGGGFRVLKAQPSNHAGAIIVDAVLQVGHRWKTHVEKRIKRIESKYPDAATISGLLRLLATVGEKELLDWNGRDEQRRFRQTIEFFSQEDVDGEKVSTVSQLARWLALDTNRDRLLTKSQREDRAGIPRVGDKTADYYRVLVGLPHAVAIDRLITRFLSEAAVRGRSRYETARTIVQLAAPVLSIIRQESIRPVDLDLSVWEYESRKEQRGEAAPALSVAAMGPKKKPKEEEMSAGNSGPLKICLPASKRALLESVAKSEFGVPASILAQVWIIGHLEQYSAIAGSPTAPSTTQVSAGNYVDIAVNKAMVKYEAIPFYKSLTVAFPLPVDVTPVALVYRGVQHPRTYNPRYPGFKFADIFRDGVSVGDTIRVTELVPCQKFKVELI